MLLNIFIAKKCPGINVEENVTEQNDGLSNQNGELPSDGDDSQLDARFQDERQPSVSHSVSSSQKKTQQEKGIIRLG